MDITDSKNEAKLNAEQYYDQCGLGDLYRYEMAKVKAQTEIVRDIEEDLQKCREKNMPSVDEFNEELYCYPQFTCGTYNW